MHRTKTCTQSSYVVELDECVASRLARFFVGG